MVPPEEIEPNAPTTLPADFGEWDSGESSATHPVAVAAPEVVPVSSAPKPAARAATARVAVLPAAGRMPSAPARPPAPVRVEPEPVYQPPQPQAAKAAPARQKAESAGEGKSKTGMFAGIGVVAILLVGGAVGYMKMRPKTVTPNQPVASQSQSQTANTNAQQPTPSMQTNGNTPAAANQPAATADTTPTDRPLGARAAEMSQAANAPSRISKDLTVLNGNQAPPSADFSGAGSEGLGAAPNVFSGQSGPKVKVAALGKVTLSSGVAVGLLVQRTTPVYPAIAKTAHVSGTVVIQATISKSGAVSNLRAVSGSAMLRQSALDAVKTWRFRPYMLDGQPVEVDTTVSVNFALAQ